MHLFTPLTAYAVLAACGFALGVALPSHVGALEDSSCTQSCLEEVIPKLRGGHFESSYCNDKAFVPMMTDCFEKTCPNDADGRLTPVWNNFLIANLHSVASKHYVFKLCKPNDKTIISVSKRGVVGVTPRQVITLPTQPPCAVSFLEVFTIVDML
jgi:hypothetical protein